MTNVRSHLARPESQGKETTCPFHSLQIEDGAPSLDEQVRQAKEQLHDLPATDAAYHTAKQRPSERRSLREELTVVLHERLQKHAEEAERLKRERDTARWGNQVVVARFFRFTKVGLRQLITRVCCSLGTEKRMGFGKRSQFPFGCTR